MPAIIAKNVDIGTERWKPSSIGEDNGKGVPSSDMPQSFISIDGNLYYLQSVNGEQIVNSFQPQGLVDAVQSVHNGTANGHDSHIYTPHQLNGQDVVSHVMQNVVQNVVQNEDNAPKKDISPEELKRMIQAQFEYYFSRENLANDSYLVSQMDSDSYVFISTIAKFNQIRKLTSDMDIIVQALRESPYVQLDETAQKVRANAKRCIVILREIPEETPIEELKALFDHPNCPKWVGFEFAHNDSWYITFECEDDARQAYHYLHEEVQVFRNKPLMARIKAQTLLSRTVYLPKTANNHSSTTVTTSPPPAVSSAPQFSTAPQPMNTFVIQQNAVFHQPQAFPFYAAAPVNSNPILPTTHWLGPRPPTTFLIQPDLNAKPNPPSKFKPPSLPFIPHNNKPRMGGNRGNNNHNFRPPKPLIPPHHQVSNGILDHDGPHVLSSGGPRRNLNANVSNANGNTTATVTSSSSSSSTSHKRESSSRSSRGGGYGRRDFRSTNGEEGSRYQRLRDRQQNKENTTKPTDATTAKPAIVEDKTADLTIDNFPALTSPMSPNGTEKNSALSLKELASSALVTPSENETQEKCSTENSTVEALTNGLNSMTKSVCANNVAKMSYAQMAQKPNKTSFNNKDVFENGDKEFIDLPAPVAEVPTKTNDKPCSKNETADTNSSCVVSKSERKSSSDLTSTNPCDAIEDDTISTPQPLPEKSLDIALTATSVAADCQTPSDNADSAPIETYASKISKIENSSTKSVSSPLSPATQSPLECTQPKPQQEPEQPEQLTVFNESNSAPLCASSSSATQTVSEPTPNVWTNSSKSNILSPKPLMSEIVSAPPTSGKQTTTPSAEKGLPMVIGVVVDDNEEAEGERIEFLAPDMVEKNKE